MSTKPTTTPQGRRLRQRAISKTLSELPTPQEAVDRILAVYDSATEEERLEGTDWYANARALALEYAAESPDHNAACAIVAALSPQCSWDQNLTNAELVCNGRHEEATQSQNAIDKALAALQGVEPLTVLGGRKVRSFYRNLAEPERTGAVTIDRHALAVILDKASRRDPKAAKVLERIGAYQYVAACYRTAARARNVTPQAMQAIVWLSWRNVHAPGWSGRDPQYNDF